MEVTPVGTIGAVAVGPGVDGGEAAGVVPGACPTPNWPKIAANAAGVCWMPLQTSDTTVTSG